VLLLATALVVPVRQILTQRGEVARLENRLERLEDQRERLSQRVARLRDPEELERIARRCLGMVKPGEIAIVPVPEDGKAPPSRC
jgi:cell division protein FtsB